MTNEDPSHISEHPRKFAAAYQNEFDENAPVAKASSDLKEFARLFGKATGKDLAEDDARWHFERLVQLYRVLLRGTGEKPGGIRCENETVHSVS